MTKLFSTTLLRKAILQCFRMLSNSNLNNYFNLHFCLSIRPSVPCVQKLTPVSAVRSQNVTNRSFLVSVKSEKYAFWVIHRPFGSMNQGKVKIHELRDSARQSRAAYIKLTSVFHHLPSVGPKQLCGLAHLRCTNDAGTS